ncbi:sulfite exporter TauE/SafE family protein [Denitrobaculum tricleocarpae]|uniref:Probable membrane transporter protein n=1 Tax=Denitrobaculum tricleocarpae TaxID=2591009 RepID=A0A545TX81_9PROT|nr:sulfite exporter TauE/SafE family protein [Denitrobaculum tricleocarpae]TQV81822.1 sulfite exporter TauE/SafE family protein [Denitrobaculum tricleocarpae]
MPDLFSLIFIALTFLLAGTVKGVIGMGLPSVSLALLTASLGLPQAMALLVVPSFVTNVWQAVTGGNALRILKRIWLFLVMASVTVWLGAAALTRVNLELLSALLGLLLVVYAVLGMSGARFSMPRRQEAWAGPLLGGVNGVLTGMTGSFVVPGVIFLQAIGLSRDMLIQSMGMLFTVSTLALAISLKGNGLLTAELGGISAVAVVPALIGMVLGQRLRRRLSEKLFRRVFFIALLLLGLYIIADAVW